MIFKYKQNLRYTLLFPFLVIPFLITHHFLDPTLLIKRTSTFVLFTIITFVLLILKPNNNQLSRYRLLLLSGQQSNFSWSNPPLDRDYYLSTGAYYYFGYGWWFCLIFMGIAFGNVQGLWSAKTERVIISGIFSEEFWFERCGNEEDYVICSLCVRCYI